MLAGLTTQSIGISHAFQYAATGEMTSLTTPLGGNLTWAYRTFAYQPVVEGRFWFWASLKLAQRAR